MKNIFNWFIWSSANPDKISATLKGAVPFLLLFGIDKYIPDTASLVDTLTSLVVGLGMVFSAGLGIYGFGRKIWLTIRS